MSRSFDLFFSMIILTALLGCAEIKQAGKAVGHAARDVTREIGHASRDAVEAIDKKSKE